MLQPWLLGLKLCPSRHLSRLADLLPNLERLEVQFFRGDDYLCSCAGAERFVGYGPQRQELGHAGVLDLMDALEGQRMCPFRSLGMVRMAVRDEFCSYITHGRGLLCCFMCEVFACVQRAQGDLEGKVAVVE